MGKLKGIDVSSHQGKIDWRQVKSAGIQFAILRAGYGNNISQKDSCFDYNFKEAKAAGLKVGVYWFSYAISKADAKKEADVCAKVLNGAKLDLPVFFDWEYDSMRYAKERGLNLTKTQITDFCITFMEQIQKHGYTAGNYANPDYLRNHLDPERLNAYPLWLACYSSTKPMGYGEAIWQYSEGGTVPGIIGGVDMNEMEDGISTPVPINTEKAEKSILKDGICTYSYKKDGEKCFSEHFQAKEFACMNDAGAVQSDSFLVNSKLVELLEKLFEKLKCKSMIITSGYRTPAFSVSIGGSATDQHTKGNAADIMCHDKTGDLIPSKIVCCTLEDMGHNGGCGYITATATHVDARGWKAWFDEAMDGGATVFDSFYSHWGMAKASSSAAKTQQNTGISAAKTQQSAKAVTRTTAVLNLRKQATTESTVLAVIPKGQVITWLQDDGWGWSQVKYNGKTGWVVNEYLTGKTGLSGYKTATCTGTGVRIRKEPSTSSAILKTIGRGTSLQIISKQSGWGRVRLGKMEGYLYLDSGYIKVK